LFASAPLAVTQARAFWDGGWGLASSVVGLGQCF